MNDSFREWMRATQADFELALAEFLPAGNLVPERLHQAMRYAALDGGKRVRPLLVYAAGRLFDAPAGLLARAAAALEMIHVYSLVHDDMPCMDDDENRRRPGRSRNCLAGSPHSPRAPTRFAGCQTGCLPRWGPPAEPPRPDLAAPRNNSSAFAPDPL